MCNRARRRERKESFRSRGRLRNRILARLESQRESSRRPMIEKKKKTDFISHLQFIINSVLYTSSSIPLSLPFSLSLSFFLFFCLRIQTEYNRGVQRNSVFVVFVYVACRLTCESCCLNVACSVVDVFGPLVSSR